MTPKQIYSKISTYSGLYETTICNLHSACSPQKHKKYLCTPPASNIKVIDFDAVKTMADHELHIDARKSVDAITVSETEKYLCFIELKSWQLLLSHNGTEEAIRKKVQKYESDLPIKFNDSLNICCQICGDNALKKEHVVYILVSDLQLENNALGVLNENLSALAGTSSNLQRLCSQLSNKLMDDIPEIKTLYCQCRELDTEITAL